MLTEKTLRRKAYNIGYRVEKGFQHYMYNGSVLTDSNGKRHTGYMIYDMSRGFYIKGYDNLFDYLCTLKDVETFLRSEYKQSGLKF
jgi:hypothetical protein